MADPNDRKKEKELIKKIKDRVQKDEKKDKGK